MVQREAVQVQTAFQVGHSGCPCFVPDNCGRDGVAVLILDLKDLARRQHGEKQQGQNPTQQQERTQSLNPQEQPGGRPKNAAPWGMRGGVAGSAHAGAQAGFEHRMGSVASESYQFPCLECEETRLRPMQKENHLQLMDPIPTQPWPS